MQLMASEELMQGMEQILHDLSQPLTVLQCRLELGLLRGGERAISDAVIEGLKECKRLNEAVHAMRELCERGTNGNLEAGETR